MKKTITLSVFIVFFSLFCYAERIDLLKLLPYALKESEWIYINPTDQEGSKFLGMGWGPVDSDKPPARWLVGQKITINLSFDNINEKNLYICIKGLSEIKDQNIKLLINQFLVDERRLTNNFEIIKFMIPSQYQSLSENKITMEFNIFSKLLAKNYLPVGLKGEVPVTAAVRWVLITEKEFVMDNVNLFMSTDFSFDSTTIPNVVLKSSQKISFFEKIRSRGSMSFSFKINKNEKRFVELNVEVKNKDKMKKYGYKAGDSGKIINIPLEGFEDDIVSMSFAVISEMGKRFGNLSEVLLIQPYIESSSNEVSLTEEEIVKLRNIKKRFSSYNLVFLLLDAAVSDHLSTYGYERKTTPYIDQLAQDGIIFNNAFTNASYTIASVATILTGLFPSTHSVLSSDFALPDDAILLSEYFKNHGFKTAAFTGNYFFSKAFGFQQGFDYFYEPPLKNLLLHSELIVNEAKDWITRNLDGKFFLYVHFREPHVPYAIPQNFNFNFWDKPIPSSKIQELRSINCTDFTQRTPEEIDFIISQYDTLLRYADSQIGKLISFLKEKKLLDKTIFIILADHGQSFWQHQIHTHSLQVYDESIRIPLIIYFPKNLNIKPARIDKLFETIDLMPTLLDLFDIQSLKKLPGKSYLNCIVFEKCPNKDYVISRNESTSNPLFSIRNNEYKLIISKSKRQFELYDLKSDSLEKNNIFNEELIITRYFLQNLDQSLRESLGYRYFMPQLSKLTGEMREKLRALGYVN